MGYLTLLKYKMAASSQKTLKRLIRCEKGMETIEIVVLSCIAVAIIVAAGILLKPAILDAVGWLVGVIRGNGAGQQVVGQ